MFNFHERRRFKRLLYSRAMLLALALAAALSVSGVWKIYTKERDTREKRQELAAALSELEVREAALTRELESLRTERGMEAEVRSKFEVGKPGETLVVIVDPKDAAAAPAEPPPGFWKRLKGWLGF